MRRSWTSHLGLNLSNSNNMQLASYQNAVLHRANRTTSSPTNTPLGPPSRRRSTTTSSTTSSMKDDKTLNNYFTNLSEQLALYTTGY
jgi:hypothetical protein